MNSDVPACICVCGLLINRLTVDELLGINTLKRIP